MITREQCLYWDQEDELKKFKDEFALPEGVIYLDGMNRTGFVGESIF